MNATFESLKQKLIIGLFVLVCSYCLTLTVFFFMQELIVLGILIFILFFIIVIWTVMICFKSLEEMMIASVIFLAITPLYALLFTIFLHHTNITVGLWLFVIPFGSLVFNDQKMAFYMSLICVLSYVLFEFIHIPAMSVFEFTPFQISFINFSTIITCSIIFIYLFFCTWQLNKKQNDDSFNREKEKEKFNLLYSQIIDLFESGKIYTNPNFSMMELADKLGSNKTYIYRALKQHGVNDNFSVLVNKYRVKKFKERVTKGSYEKYKINYLFESCGFKFQSAFNKVFKELEGITPSEYITLQKLKKEKQENTFK